MIILIFPQSCLQMFYEFSLHFSLYLFIIFLSAFMRKHVQIKKICVNFYKLQVMSFDQAQDSQFHIDWFERSPKCINLQSQPLPSEIWGQLIHSHDLKKKTHLINEDHESNQAQIQLNNFNQKEHHKQLQDNIQHYQPQFYDTPFIQEYIKSEEWNQKRSYGNEVGQEPFNQDNITIESDRSTQWENIVANVIFFLFQQQSISSKQNSQHKISHQETHNIRKNDRFDSMKVIIDDYTKNLNVKRKLKQNIKKTRNLHYIFYWVVFMGEEGENIDILLLKEKSLKVIEERSRYKGADYYEALKESVDRMIRAVEMFKQGQKKEAIDFAYGKGQPIEKINHISKEKHEECLKLFVPMYHQTNRVT